MIGCQEGVQIFLHRDTPHIEHDRPRQIGKERGRRRVGREGAQIHAPAPRPHLGDAMGAQLLAYRPGRHQHRLRGSVEPADIAPEPGGRQPGPLGDIIGKMRMIGRGEGHAAAQAPAPGGDAERAFGRQMDGIWPEGGNLMPHNARPHQRQPDFRIGRTGDRPVKVGRDDLDRVAHALQFALDRLQRPHHAIDLRGPGVGNDRDPHWLLRQAASREDCFAVSWAVRAAISSAQCSTSIRPSKSSTSAVQPSTQSPSL